MKRVLETKLSGEKQEQGVKGQFGLAAPLWQTRRDRVVWSIAGFDPSSGAGVTADLMTFAAAGLFGCSAITALTVQTTRGVFRWSPVAADVLTSTLARLDEDLPPEGIKIGMLGTPELANVVVDFLRRRADRTKAVVVLDPVLRSSSGRALFPEEGLSALRDKLLPFVDWATPNWAELALLSDIPVTDISTAERAGRVLMERYDHLGLVVTGGDQERPADLVLEPNGATTTLSGDRVTTSSTHGTGCAFSSALLSHLVRGTGPVEAARVAKSFVQGALRRAPGIGGGRGPMDLLWPLREAEPQG